ncbi:MAG TPA: ATP-binding protein [Vicinamibacterales bacterium]|nr:ATP-binding protein [Vicinamibacterales bacterium]
MTWRLRLHHRIVIPFAVIALFATAASAFLVLSIVSRAFEERLLYQLQNTADVISRGGFAFNLVIIRSVKAITGADVITFDDAGNIVATTIEPARTEVIRAVTSSPGVDEARAAGFGGLVKQMNCDTPCYVAYRPIADRPGVLLAIVAEPSESAAAVSAVSRSILLAALASLAALVLVSQLVARRVTAPIDNLVRFSQEVGGGTSRRAHEGDDDVGRLGRAFNQMLDRLDESKVTKVRNEKLALAGLFAARVAHDIRNPLASMKINTQMLEPAVKNDPHNAALVNATLQDISQVEFVIRDLIELARPGELRRVPADINAVIRSVVRQLDARLTHRKVTTSLTLPDRLPLVSIDVERFSQVLTNVFVNAIDAMPTGGTLTAATRADDAQLTIEVDDEGVGIDPSMVTRVFDPFVSTKPEGVGLGLVNAKAVVEGHGGRIELTPRQPRGTRAKITLPVTG